MGGILKLIGLVVVIAFGLGAYNAYDVCNGAQPSVLAAEYRAQDRLPIWGDIMVVGFDLATNLFCD